MKRGRPGGYAGAPRFWAGEKEYLGEDETVLHSVKESQAGHPAWDFLNRQPADR